jgi:hypothetical protein
MAARDCRGGMVATTFGADAEADPATAKKIARTEKNEI